MAWSASREYTECARRFVGSSPMPFSFIPTVLGACFALVWIFIGAMIVRDGQFAARRDRETDESGALTTRRQESTLTGPHWGPNRRAKNARRARPISAA